MSNERGWHIVQRLGFSSVERSIILFLETRSQTRSSASTDDVDSKRGCDAGELARAVIRDNRGAELGGASRVLRGDQSSIQEIVLFEGTGHFAAWSMPDRFLQELVGRVRPHTAPP